MVTKKLQAELNHELVRAVFVCSECGRYRVEKVLALPKKFPKEEHEYCPVCEKNTKFLKI